MVVTDYSTTLTLKEAALVATYVTLVTTRLLVLQRVHDEGVSSIEGHATVGAGVFSADSGLRLGLLLYGCGLRVHVCAVVFDGF